MPYRLAALMMLTLSPAPLGGAPPFFAQTAGQITAPPGQPPLDPSLPGTATIRGHIFAGDTGQPLRRAQVRIFAVEMRENRLATTDANGAYEFTDVRAGRYTATASKGSYVSISYGQQRLTDAPKPIEIHDRELVERLDFSLPRGGVISGQIVDEFGEPMPEVSVTVERYQFVRGRRTLAPTGRQVSTNDLGEFRLFGVTPGQYYLTATSRGQQFGFTPNSIDRTAYPRTYFPGTTNAAEAQRLAIQSGQELADLVMVLRPIQAARITGTVTGTDGKPMVPGNVMLSSTNGFGFMSAGGAPVRPDGTFTLSNVAPGEYTLRAQRMGPPSSTGEGPEFAVTKLVVAGEDISDVHLAASPPSIATGRIVVDPALVAQLPTPLVLSVFPLEFDGTPPPPPARVADDFTFEIKAAPGVMRIGLGGFGPPPHGWTIRSVRLNGTDVTDSGLLFKPNENISGVEIELTNRLATVSGLVTDSRGNPATDYTAIVFSQDKEKWTQNTRYQGAGRPDQDGRFKISSLPPGEYYAIAVDRIEPGETGDPDFLESLRTRASPFSLLEGETRTIDLKLNPSS